MMLPAVSSPVAVYCRACAEQPPAHEFREFPAYANMRPDEGIWRT